MRGRAIRLAAGVLLLAGALAPAVAIAAPAVPPPARSAAAPVAPASVAVTLEDAEGVLTPDQATLLERRLAGLKTRGAAVVYVRRAPDGVERLAEATFARLRLPDDAVAVAVAVDDRAVAAHAGPAISARGVDAAVIKGLIGMHFKASARRGRYDLAAGALAEAIVDARPGEAPPAPAPSAPAPEPWWAWLLQRAIDMLWVAGLLLALAVVGVLLVILGPGFFAPAPAAPRPSTARPREVEVAELQEAAARLAAEVEPLRAALASHGPGGATEVAAAVGAELAAFRERYAAFVAAEERAASAVADDQASGGAAGPSAAPDLGTLTMTALNLEVAIAALRTAFAGHGPERVSEALVVGRRWKAVEAQTEYLVREGVVEGTNGTFLQDAVAAAWQALRGVPQDLATAGRKLGAAELRLKGLARSRSAYGPAWTAVAAASATTYHDRLHHHGWDTACVVIEAVDAPAPVSSGASGSGGWDAGGSGSGSSSWGTSDAGSSSDSGSASWSSSDDSGSSSWDAGSSGGSTGSDRW